MQFPLGALGSGQDYTSALRVCDHFWACWGLINQDPKRQSLTLYKDGPALTCRQWAIIEHHPFSPLPSVSQLQFTTNPLLLS